MLHIDIHIPRPWLTTGVVAAIAVYVFGGMETLPVIGGTNDAFAAPQAQVVQAEQQILAERSKQDVLNKRESILRAEMDALEAEMGRTNNPQALLELMETRNSLIKLLDDKQRSEQIILAALQDLWNAQDTASRASLANSTYGTPVFMWPVEPTLGVSAHFDDDGYEQRFGMEHNAVDIPVLQGSTIYAAADGVVVSVSDKGMGFSSLVIQHGGGYATMYGHVSGFLVEEGQAVRAGEPVALSGGTPGTLGAGSMTTGAHLHLELHKDGVQVDPLSVLPPHRNVR